MVAPESSPTNLNFGVAEILKLLFGQSLITLLLSPSLCLLSLSLNNEINENHIENTTVPR